jgi:murein DD-endopeptidase MepM/ murein hydrolase activator NlpD
MRPRGAAAPPRTPGPTGIRRGRLAAAAVAAGALATAGHSLANLEAADAPTTELASLSLTSGSTPARTAPTDGVDPATSGVLPTATPAARPAASAADHARSLAKASQRAAKSRAAAVPAAEFIKPAQGRFTSGFGSRWGTSHLGVDIANSIGTPIVSVADGVVTAAGPASGFGQWVKVRLADGTETIYGHVNRFFVKTGERVKAGDRIAEIGNKGQSTGPHLHFEVHTPGGKKINPLPWLAERGISLGAQQD